MNQQKYLLQKDVSEILNVRIETLNQWRCNQKYNIPYIKIGRRILYPIDQFYKWLESHQKNNNIE